jgi:hypothetical protein
MNRASGYLIKAICICHVSLLIAHKCRAHSFTFCNRADCGAGILKILFAGHLYANTEGQRRRHDEELQDEPVSGCEQHKHGRN